MKHGPIALVDPLTPSVFSNSERCGFTRKSFSTLKEIKARKGQIIAVVSQGDDRVHNLADEIIELPECPDFLNPIVASIPLQLLAYHIALLRGCDVDKPRNLAKSVDRGITRAFRVLGCASGCFFRIVFFSANRAIRTAWGSHRQFLNFSW